MLRGRAPLRRQAPLGIHDRPPGGTAPSLSPERSPVAYGGIFPGVPGDRAEVLAHAGDEVAAVVRAGLARWLDRPAPVETAEPHANRHRRTIAGVSWPKVPVVGGGVGAPRPAVRPVPAARPRRNRCAPG